MYLELRANVVIFLLNELLKLNQTWLFLSVPYVIVQSLIKFYVITVLHFISEGREKRYFNTQSTPLVAALITTASLKSYGYLIPFVVYRVFCD